MTATLMASEKEGFDKASASPLFQRPKLVHKEASALCKMLPPVLRHHHWTWLVILDNNILVETIKRRRVRCKINKKAFDIEPFGYLEEIKGWLYNRCTRIQELYRMNLYNDFFPYIRDRWSTLFLAVTGEKISKSSIEQIRAVWEGDRGLKTFCQ